MEIQYWTVCKEWEFMEHMVLCKIRLSNPSTQGSSTLLSPGRLCTYKHDEPCSGTNQTKAQHGKWEINTKSHPNREVAFNWHRLVKGTSVCSREDFPPFTTSLQGRYHAQKQVVDTMVSVCVFCNVLTFLSCFCLLVCFITLAFSFLFSS